MIKKFIIGATCLAFSLPMTANAFIVFDIPNIILTSKVAEKSNEIAGLKEKRNQQDYLQYEQVNKDTNTTIELLTSISEKLSGTAEEFDAYGVAEDAVAEPVYVELSGGGADIGGAGGGMDPAYAPTLDEVSTLLEAIQGFLPYKSTPDFWSQLKPIVPEEGGHGEAGALPGRKIAPGAAFKSISTVSHQRPASESAEDIAKARSNLNKMAYMAGTRVIQLADARNSVLNQLRLRAQNKEGLSIKQLQDEQVYLQEEIATLVRGSIQTETLAMNIETKKQQLDEAIKELESNFAEYSADNVVSGGSLKNLVAN